MNQFNNKKSNLEFAQALAAGYSMSSKKGQIQTLYWQQFLMSPDPSLLQNSQSVSKLTPMNSMQIDGQLMKILTKQHVRAVALIDQLIGTYETQVLRSSLQSLGEYYGVNIDLVVDLIPYNAKYGIPQNKMAKELLLMCPNLTYNCIDTYDIAIGNQEITANNSFIFSERFYDGVHVMCGTSDVICYLEDGFYNSEYERDKVKELLKTKQGLLVSNYHQMAQKLEAGNCSAFVLQEFCAYNKLKYTNPQNDGPFFASVFRSDSVQNSYQNTTEYKQQLIQFSVISNNVYYGTIIVVTISLAFCILPIIAMVLFKSTRPVML
ncbi:Hypothetical_protein [Hexamita inflata]|uniref:Hypothetical_protein n=1 Tax=Hexamita inflata TaxID=28002 RepID=A0AA86TZH4_9EUKA|nr:Hypothetical protein HINF_LOCUS22094 [Hexamita inflata]